MPNRKEASALQVMERAREACEPPSWYQLAKRLGVSTATIKQWRDRDGAFDDEAAWNIAEILNEDPARIIAIREAAREKNAERRERWKMRLKRIGGALCLVMIDSTLYPSLSAENWDSSLSTNSKPSWQSEAEKKGATNEAAERLRVNLSTNYAQVVAWLKQLWRKALGARRMTARKPPWCAFRTPTTIPQPAAGICRA